MKTSTPVTPKLCQHIITCPSERIGMVQIGSTRQKMLDMVGCLIAGAMAQGNGTFVHDWARKYTKEEAAHSVPLFALPAHISAPIASVLCRSYDFEVMNYGHLYATLLPVALAVGAEERATGRQIATAIVLAVDFCTRLNAAAGPGMPGNTDPVGTSTMLAATAAAGRLVGLTPQQLSYAFGFAMNMFCGSFQNLWEGAMSFKFLQGWSAHCAVTAVQMAKLNWTAPFDALLGPRGYFACNTANGCQNPEHLTQHLGDDFYDFAVYKLYPGCRFTHAALENALVIHRQMGVPAPWQKIQIFLSHGVKSTFVCQPFDIDSPSQCKALFSLRYAVACALWEGAVSPQSYTGEAMKRLLSQVDINKIQLLEEPSYQGDECRLTISGGAGKEVNAYTPYACGEKERPVTSGELEAKYWNNVQFHMFFDHKKAQILRDACLGIWDLPNVTPFFENLRLGDLQLNL